MQVTNLASLAHITSYFTFIVTESWSLAHRVWRQTKNWSNDRKNFAFFVVSRPVVNFAPVEFIDLVEDARTNNMLMQLKVGELCVCVVRVCVWLWLWCVCV